MLNPGQVGARAAQCTVGGSSASRRQVGAVHWADAFGALSREHRALFLPRDAAAAAGTGRSAGAGGGGGGGGGTDESSVRRAIANAILTYETSPLTHPTPPPPAAPHQRHGARPARQVA